MMNRNKPKTAESGRWPQSMAVLITRSEKQVESFGVMRDGLYALRAPQTSSGSQLSEIPEGASVLHESRRN